MIQGFHRRRAWLAVLMVLTSLGRARPSGARISPREAPPEETAVFAGGCFWGVQAVFQRVKGVTRAVSGYAGGSADSAQYEAVSRGTTGHAESVQVTYDPARRSRTRRSCRCSSPWPTTRRSSTARVPTWGRSTGRRSSTRPPAQKASAQAHIDQLAAAKAFPRRDRDAGRPARRLLPGRGVSPGLPGQAPQRPVHRDARLAEDRQPPEAVPEPLRREIARTATPAERVADRGRSGRAPTGACRGTMKSC